MYKISCSSVAVFEPFSDVYKKYVKQVGNAYEQVKHFIEVTKYSPHAA